MTYEDFISETLRRLGSVASTHLEWKVTAWPHGNATIAVHHEDRDQNVMWLKSYPHANVGKTYAWEIFTAAPYGPAMRCRAALGDMTVPGQLSPNMGHSELPST